MWWGDYKRSVYKKVCKRVLLWEEKKFEEVKIELRSRAGGRLVVMGEGALGEFSNFRRGANVRQFNSLFS